VREKRECRCRVREDRRVRIKKMRLTQDLALSDKNGNRKNKHGSKKWA